MTKAPKLTETEAELEKLYQQYAGLGWEGVFKEFADAPPWNDDDENYTQLEYVLDRWLGYWTVDFPIRSDEERAVEAASRGDRKKLIAFIKTNPQLAQSTRDLIIEFLDGKRLLSGKAKGKRGPRRQSEKQRRAFNITHQAAEISLVIQSGLSLIYPEKSEAQIHDRALLLAEMLTGVSYKTIQGHLEKSKNQRLPFRVYGHYEEEEGPNGCWVEDLLGPRATVMRRIAIQRRRIASRR